MLQLIERFDHCLGCTFEIVRLGVSRTVLDINLRPFPMRLSCSYENPPDLHYYLQCYKYIMYSSTKAVAAAHLSGFRISTILNQIYLQQERKRS